MHQSSKKRAPSSWLETDLDSGLTQEHSVASSPALSASKPNGRASPYHAPLYQQPLSSPQYVKEIQACSPGSTSSSSSSRYCGAGGRQVQGQASSPQGCNGMTSLSPQLREQIQQHQLKQQLLKDQMQGKSASPVQNNNVPLYVNAMVPDPRRLGESISHLLRSFLATHRTILFSSHRSVSIRERASFIRGSIRKFPAVHVTFLNAQSLEWKRDISLPFAKVLSNRVSIPCASLSKSASLTSVSASRYQHTHIEMHPQIHVQYIESSQLKFSAI